MSQSSTYRLRLIVETEDKTSQPAKKAAKGMDLLKTAAKATAVAFAAIKSAKVVAEFVKIGAAAQRQRTALDNLAAAAGTSGSAIVKSIQRASDFTIDKMSAMQAANRAMIMEVASSPAEFEKLTKVAVGLGRAMGVDAVTSIDRFVTASGRQSMKIADDLGLIIKLEDAYQKYADANNISAGSMDAAAKSAAFLAEMLAQGEKKLQKLGDTTIDTAGKIERITAAWTDAKTAAAGLAATAADQSGILDIVADDMGGLAKLSGAIDELGFSYKAMWSYNMAGLFKGDEAALQAYYQTMARMGLASVDAAEGHKLLRGEVVRETESIVTNTQSRTEQYAAMYETQRAQEALASTTPIAIQAMKDSTLATEDAAKAQLDLSAGLKDATDAQIAQAAISELGQALEDGEISFDTYRTAVSETQLAFGLADEKSVFLADKLGTLTEALADGTLKADGYDEALEELVKQSELVGTALGKVIDELNAMPSEKVIRIRYELQGDPNDRGDKRQHGGPVSAGSPYIVGEAGPELFVPNASGRIVPNNQIDSHDTYNFNTQSAAAVGMTGKRRRYISRLM